MRGFGRHLRTCTSGLIVGCAAVAPAAAQAVGSRTGGSRVGIDVLHYEFRVDFPNRDVPDTIRFVATTTAHRTSSTSALALDLSVALHVDSVRVNRTRVEYARPGDSVRVALPPGMNDTVQVAVFYHGFPTDGLITRPDSALGWTAFGDNFPNRARQWLATVDHPSDKALVDWIVRAPATHRVIANGELVEETPEPGPRASRMVRTHWRSARPLYTAVMVIGVAPFAVQALGTGSCSRRGVASCPSQSVWTSPAQRAALADAQLPGGFACAGDMVSLFERLVGQFPYEKLAHVASATRYGGMENAAAIFYAEDLFRPGSPSESLIAHETAHQWFGDAVTVRTWPHIWLSEGFATYFAALWAEQAHGDSAFRRVLTDMRGTVLKSTIAWDRPVVDEALDDVARVLNSNVYQKAGFVLHMLRREVGDSTFFRGVRSYYAAHRDGNATTSDVQREFERAAGRSLEWFFAQWMRRPGYAELETSWRWDARTQRVLLTVRQGARVAPYRLLLAVGVTDASGVLRHTRVRVPAAATSTITVPIVLPRAPQAVILDADGALLGTTRSRP